MGPSDPSRKGLLGRLAALKGERISRSREFDWEVIDPGEILYLFIARPKLTKIIDAPWTEELHFLTGQLYFRTAAGVYETPYRAFTRVVNLLDGRFKRVHASIMANVRAARSVRLTSRRASIGYSIDQ